MSEKEEQTVSPEQIFSQANRALGIIAGIARDCIYNFGERTFEFQSEEHRAEFVESFDNHAKQSGGVPDDSYSKSINGQSVKITITKPETIKLAQVLEFAKQHPKALTPSEKVKLNIGNEWQAPKSRPLNEKDGIRIVAEIARHAGVHTTESENEGTKQINLTVMIRTTVDSVREEAIAKITANLARIGVVVGEDLSFSRQGESNTYSTEILNKDFASKIDNAAYIKIIHSNVIAA